MEKGQIDAIVSRVELRKTLGQLLDYSKGPVVASE